MKIVIWNLKNIGETKLTNSTNAIMAAKGFGSNVLDFMINLVMGNSIWSSVNPSLDPADVFVVIELKCGGQAKDADASDGAAVNFLKTVVTAMNTVVSKTPSLNGKYLYDAAPPKIIGHHETVGVIFNTKVLTYKSGKVLRDSKKNFLLPRAPYAAWFQHIPTAQNLLITGLHAPPPGGGANRFKSPICFATKLPSVPELMTLPSTTTVLIGGDYNCSPKDTWKSKGVNLTPFDNPSPPAAKDLTLTNYRTLLPANTLSSVRAKFAPKQSGQSQYLNAYYDNILYKNVTPTKETVTDLIGPVPGIVGTTAPTVGLVASRNNYWTVSDHLPVVLIV